MMQQGHSDIHPSARQCARRQLLEFAHDVRTPLTAARLASEQILRRVADQPSVYTLANRIIKNIDRAESMLCDLLDKKRRENELTAARRGSKQTFNAMVRTTLADLVHIHGDRFVLTSNDELTGNWDMKALRRLVENLLSNAVKYGREDAPVQIIICRQGSWVKLEISNEGFGISPPQRASVFDAFERLPSARQSGQVGWGLGLSIVKSIAHAHGGTVQVKSGDESGCTFQVYLPLAV